MVGLGDVPFEVKCLIASHLDVPHLQALSLTNKSCERPASAQLFSTVRLTFPPPIGLIVEDETGSWSQLLSRRLSFRHVRRLEVTDERQSPPVDINLNIRSHHARLWALSDHEPDVEEEEEEEEDHNPYAPLLQFFKLLPAVKDLVWACSPQFPSDLLHELHHFRPSCRLHLEFFRLRSLKRLRDLSPKLDVHETQLVTSPALYRVALRRSRGHDGIVSDKDALEILHSMVQGRAPHLKEICVAQPCLRMTMASSQLFLRDDSRAPETSTRGALTSLEIRDGSGASRERMARWRQATNFTVLKELRFHAWLEADTLQDLSSVHWLSLRRLQLRLPPLRNRQLWHRLQPFNETFLLSFKGLRDLELDGGLTWVAVVPVLRHHGETLRRLSVSTLMLREVDRFEDLRRWCPKLTELSIAMPRTQGKGCEQAIYHTLGGFRNLQRITLMLDCSAAAARTGEASGTREQAGSYGLPQLDSLLHAYGSSHKLSASTKTAIWQAWANARMDENTAASIFSQITHSRFTHASPLQVLNLCLRKPGEVQLEDVEEADLLIKMVHWDPRPDVPRPRNLLGTSWQCCGLVGWDGAIECDVHELYEDHEAKGANIEDHSLRGIDVRPLFR